MKYLILFVTCILCHAEEKQIVFTEPPPNFSPTFEVAACYCECDHQILYLMRHPEKPQGGTWCVPGGKLEQGESSRQALVREVEEEIGWQLKEEDLKYCSSVYVRYPRQDFVLHLFFTTFQRVPPLHISTEEHVDYMWVDPNAIEELRIIPGGKCCLDIVRNCR
ncbi:MAG: hypothetical protein RLZZ453_498 [Chlamydiota bacterium]|jgi:8-oxo-dGTP diphosphatase